MGRPTTTVELTIRYEPSENGWMTASIPALPGTISMGRTRGEARENVLDAFAAMLAVNPATSPVGPAREERVRFDLGLLRVIDPGRGREL
jgi:predicted RNase H-like HicB family nuclease